MRRLLCLALVGLAAGCSPAAKPEPIWVGHLGPLSGPDRDVGEESVRAIGAVLEQAQQDDFKVTGGRPVGVRHVDGASGKARAEAVRLLAVNGVSALIVGPGLGDVEGVVAAARSHPAPVIVLDEVADPPSSSGVVLLGPDPAARGEKLAEAARETLKISKVAVVVDPSRPVCARLAEAFARTWRDKGGESRSWNLPALQGPEGYGPVPGWQAEAVLLAVPSSMLLDPKRPLAPLVKGQTILYGGEDTEALARGDLLRGEAHKELLGVTAYRGKDDLTAEGKKLFEALAKKPGPPPGRASALAADGIRFMLEAMLSAKGAARDRLRDAFAEASAFETVCGPLEKRDARLYRPLFVVRHPPAKE
jgi:ABC-type branched-subunit amino acid transport system substrate-binding protein